nr:MAG: hypothetical protein [Chemarfal virus 53]
MTKIAMKRSREDEDAHQELTVSNVEFCMMQFYKMQWESQQAENERLRQVCKKLKRDNDHCTVVRNQMANDIVNLEIDVGDLRDLNEFLTGSLQSANNQVRLLKESLENAEFQIQMLKWDQVTQPAVSDEETEDEEEEVPMLG